MMLFVYVPPDTVVSNPLMVTFRPDSEVTVTSILSLSILSGTPATTIDGAVVSLVTTSGVAVTLLPAGSVTATTMLFCPSARGTTALKLPSGMTCTQLPFTVALSILGFKGVLLAMSSDT